MPRRIAVLGFRLESNAHAPVCGAEEFVLFRGAALAADLALPIPRAPQEVSAFLAAFAGNGSVEVVPLSIATGGAAGPVLQDFLDDWIADALARLDALGGVDGVYLAQHGAIISTASHDPDGDLIAAIRRHLGAAVPIVVSLDPHANVSRRMTANCDALIAYRTNPHIDQRARGTEAAALMARLLEGERTGLSFCKIPLIPPSTAQNTTGGPLGEHVAFAQGFVGGDILAVCVCSGFSVGDSAKAGMSVTVTARQGSAAGPDVARRVAQRIWDERRRFDVRLTPIAEAVARMVAVNRDPALPALCFADVADNPGGGGRGNTTWILRAMREAGCRDLVLVPFYDPALAREAAALGVGARFEARLNRDESSPHSRPMTLGATVLRLHDEEIACRRGILAGRRASMGLTALLECDGIRIVVTSRRVQFCDPAMLECLGIPLDQPRGLIVKSRGHFRASVDEVFADAQIVEVDAPGLTTPVLSRVDWQFVPRPLYPLDPEMDWSLEASL
jgi:microcystin degradation protein MlrC